MVTELRKIGVIGDVTIHKSGQSLPIERINHYITDGDVAVASLIAECSHAADPSPAASR